MKIIPGNTSKGGHYSLGVLSHGTLYISCRVYIPDVSLWDEVNAAYAEFFGTHRPARVMVPTTALHHGALVEIEAIAETEE